MLVAVAMALAAIVYLNALPNPFVYDDLVVIVENRALEAPWSVAAALELSAFRPVTALSYALDRAIWRLEPFGYHLTSVLLHVLNTGLVFLLAVVLGADRMRGLNPPVDRVLGTPPPNAALAAFAVAGLFAVHPALTEAVSYVSARSEVLATTLVLAAFLALRAALLTGRAVWTVMGVGLFVLALGAREVAAALPFVLLVYDRIVLGGTPEGRRRRLVRWHVPLLATTIAAGALRLVLYVSHEGGALEATARYVATQAGVVWRYVKLLLVPVGLSLVHHTPVAGVTDAWTLVALAGLVALVAVAIVARREEPWVALGIAWFLLALAPTSVVPLRDVMAEHRLYLASIGLLLALVAVGARLGARLPIDSSRRRAVGATIVVVIVIVLGVLTLARNAVWADPVVLWQDAATKSPQSATARAGLANALAQAGRCGAAIPEYDASLRLAPAPGVFTNLASCLVAERRVDEALAAYQRALALEPRYVAAHHNLALLALHRGDRDRAHEHFLRAIAPDWRRPRWREDLIALHERSIDDPAKTLELCRELLRVASETAGVRECIARNEARLAKRAASG